MFSKILIANRGEIAVRIIRACKEMGISTVAVYSEADAEALHVDLADESYCIGACEASDSYLNEERILSAALVSGAQAIHPGYGFLSENDQFADLCARHGVAFIGPSVHNMRTLADKAKTKALMQQAGLPVIPGSEQIASPAQARETAKRVGYPVMLKAAMGGGGRGIRLVSGPDEIEPAFLAAKTESEAAFGSGAIYLEKYIHPARHIEIQVLADEFGNVVCLGERDCSVQRRNQKIIEESPSPALRQAQRDELYRTASSAVASIGYTGAGTLEFLYDGTNFYFMEMNVRLQVEHTVTEALTGIDIVKWQIRIAAGVPISFRQADIDISGAAIECRINASAPGKVRFMHVPGGPFVRFDTFLLTGTTVTPYYDSLLGKLIVYSPLREEAIRKLKAALCELVIDGVPNNIKEQIALVGESAFMDGSYDLSFLAQR